MINWCRRFGDAGITVFMAIFLVIASPIITIILGLGCPPFGPTFWPCLWISYLNGEYTNETTRYQWFDPRPSHVAMVVAAILLVVQNFNPDYTRAYNVAGTVFWLLTTIKVFAVALRLYLLEEWRKTTTCRGK